MNLSEAQKKAKAAQKQRKGRTLTGQPANQVVVFDGTTPDPAQVGATRRLAFEDVADVNIPKVTYQINEYINRLPSPFDRPQAGPPLNGVDIGTDHYIDSKVIEPEAQHARFGDHFQQLRRKAMKRWQYIESGNGGDD